MNRRIHQLEDVDRVFVYPNMGDGGCATGAALHLSPPTHSVALRDVYLGPEYGDDAIEREINRSGMTATAPPNLEAEIAGRLEAGQIVARFAGRMEYGPRALGNRSILCSARDPDVNRTLNHRLGRTEFMPFAPVTLWEERHRCYRRLDGAEQAAELMTVTVDCTEWMIENCPAAVHVDGTARPQLIRREINPGYYDIIAAYFERTGVPCLVNTSFNLHEEPIACTPADALRTFIRSDLECLAIGRYLVTRPIEGG